MGIHTYGTNAVDWESGIDLDRLRTERLARLQRRAGAVVARRRAGLRLRQHPLHDRDPHRHVGDRQADPLLPAHPRRRPDHLGLRLGGPAPPAVQPVARPRPPSPTPTRTPRTTAPSRPARQTGARAGHLDAARRLPPRRRDRRGGRRARSSASSEKYGSARRAARRRRHRAAHPARAPGTPASSVVDGQQVFLEARRIKTRDEIRLLTQAASMVDAAYEELYRVPAARGARERVRRPGRQDALRPRLGVRRGRQRDLRRALLAAPARLLRPASSAPATRRSSTSCTATTATAPATTARSRSAARRRPSATPTPIAREYMDRAIALVQARRDDRRHRRGLADGAGVRLRRRGGRVRPAVRPRRRPVDLGEADLLAGWSRSTTPRCSRRGWSSRWRPTGRPPTAGRRRPHRGGGRRHRRRAAR